jgi:hypothetical protein
MTPEMKQQLEAFSLAALAAIGDVGMIESTLVRDARLQVHPQITGPELSETLRGLADRGLVRSFIPALGAHRWRVTDVGRDIAVEKGLA